MPQCSICTSFSHLLGLSPEPDKLPDGVADVRRALRTGDRFVEVGELGRSDRHAPGALAEAVILLQTL